MAQVRVWRRAFTLTDLIVVGTLTVLLVPLVPPLLRDAGEQTRVAKCLSNLHELMRATSAYLNDYENRFPLVRDPSWGAVCTWGYGGKTTRDYWGPQFGWFWSEVQDKALNPYLMGARIEPDVVYADQTRQRTEVRVVRCPSDRSSHESLDWQGPPNQAPNAISCYDDVGTSYQYNLHALDPGPGAVSLVTPWGGSLWELDPARPALGWLVANNAAVREVLNGQAATFTFYIEDPMDWGLQFGVSLAGNHGELSKHSAGYLDGHADYIVRDTRSNGGTGWEAVVRAWLWPRSGPNQGMRPRPYAYSTDYFGIDPPWWQ